MTVSAIALKVYLGLTDAALGSELVQNPGFETVEPTINYLLNPSFEVNVTDDWTFAQGGAGGSVARDNTYAKVGTYSAKIVGSNADYSLINSVAGVVVPNNAYVTASGWVRCSADPTGSKALLGMTDGISQTGYAAATAAANGAWEYLTVTVQNTAGVDRTFNVRAINYFNTSAESMWADSIQLEAGTDDTSYCDGTLTPDCWWNGTAHNSTSQRVLFGSWWEGSYYNYLIDLGTNPGDNVADSATSHGGTHAATLTSVSDYQYNWREVSQEIAVTPGAKYRFSFWHRGDGGASARYALRDTVTNELLLGATGAISTGNISTTYAQTVIDFYAPEGCTTLSIQLGSPKETGQVYVDDVSLKEITWSWVDKSADVLTGLSVRWGRGMLGAGLFDLVAGTGIASFSLDNSESEVTTRAQGQYSPAHANCLAGFAIGCPVKLTLDVDGGGETVEFIGRIASIAPSAGMYRSEAVDVEAHDWMGYVSNQQLGPHVLATNQRIDQGITTALADFPIQPESTSIGTGIQTFLTLFDNETSQTSMASFFWNLTRGEFGRIYLTGNGSLVVEPRRYRAESITSLFTLNGQMSELEVRYDLADIANVVIVTVHPYRIDTSTVRIFDLANAGCPKIEPGETLDLICPFSNPEGGGRISATGVVNPTTVLEFGSAPDYTSNDLAAFLTQANEVFSNQVIAHLTNAGTKTGYLNDFQIYGLGIYRFSPIEIEARDEFGIMVGPGERKETFSLPQISDPATGALFADFIKDKVSRQHIKGVTVSFRANQDATLAAAAAGTVEISKRFTLIEGATGLSTDFFVNRVDYTYRDGRLDCEILAVPASNTDCWIWDSSTWDNTDGEGWTI